MTSNSDIISNEDPDQDQHPNKDPLSQLNLPSPLILGSNSFTRKLILQEMNIPFLLKVKPIDEYEIGIRDDESHAHNLVVTLAKAKADALVQGILDSNSNNHHKDENANDNDDNDNDQDDKFNLKLPNYDQHSSEYIILTADQVVTCNNNILEKPKSIEESHEFICQYGTHPPKTVGSVVLTHLPSRKSVCGVDVSTIYFNKRLGEESEYRQLVERLLGDGAPILSCAGGLMVEHPFVEEYIERIDGSVDGVMGLSKDLVCRLLEELKGEIASS
eukprot:CAMPEP_0203683000 /NCGR_PEP_ID=MMETSP0090-20130426/47294_1 /ASSEMBLY_ACC=CAM_ASM_001088 /TAXON_ID=426623 /ORGANISM="Chaetoceros affinis, Strain CCMP159" /LENGTH=273 /DNA_ID=CAMNT_0050552121 /DNA_START=785 /DNA_END=1606 /DNA_ORIENTATION=+